MAEVNENQKIKHHRFTAVVFYVVLIVSAGLIGFGLSVVIRYLQNDYTDFANIPVVLPNGLAQNQNNIIPFKVAIPGINLNAAIVQVGLGSDGSLQVPSAATQVGWFRYSPTPGKTGPAILVGHLDTKDGPAIFWDLKKLKAGDMINVSLSNDTTAVFKVDQLENYSQDNFPTDKVYGKINYSGLRVITCSGTYNVLKQRYSDNLVVYATLVQTIKGAG